MKFPPMILPPLWQRSSPCSASTGYHVENASPADLQKMLEVNQQLIEALKERVTAMLASLSE